VGFLLARHNPLEACRFNGESVCGPFLILYICCMSLVFGPSTSLAWHLRHALNACGCVLAMVALMGCSHMPPSGVVHPQSIEPGVQVWQSADKAQWREVRFPGKNATTYTPVSLDGQAWLRADAQSSASMLRQKIDPSLGPFSRIRFSLVVEQPLMNADVARQDREDSPARVILAFDGDRSEFSARESALSEISHLMTGEPMPYATLMYVWCPKREVGSVVHNPRIDRIRKVVVAGPGGGQTHHLIHRDIRADYEKAFGRPPGRLIGIAIMTDSDNTQGRARALYGPIEMW
jgi:hypothetical protein